VLDFTDAILASVAGTDPVATFDQKFIRKLRQQGGKSYWTDR
jgi:hypothetical protein